ETDVVAVEINIDEAAQLALVVEQPLAHPRMALFEVLDNSADRLARGRNLVGASGEPAQRRRYSYPDWHDRNSYLQTSRETSAEPSVLLSMLRPMALQARRLRAQAAPLSERLPSPRLS